MLRFNRFVVVVLLLISAVAFGQERGLQPQDFYKEVVVEDVAVSPDGTLLAFTRMNIDEKKNRRHREIWLVSIEDGKPSGEPYRFTSPLHESRVPRWSPDGKLLSFTSSRGDDRNPVWFARVTAPGGEPFHIDGVESTPVWSPDGKWIAFIKAPTPEGGPRRGKREGWIAPDTLTNTLDAERFDGHVITSMRYKANGIPGVRPHPSTFPKPQLYVVSASGGESKQLTDLPFAVRGVVWTADSSAITFGGDPLEDDEYSSESTANIYRVSREGGEPMELTGEPGSEVAHSISPDGTRIAYRYAAAERGAESDILVDMFNDDGTLAGQPRNLTADWDLEPGNLQWSADGSSIYFTALDHGSSHLFSVNADSAEIKKVIDGTRFVGAVDFDRKNRIVAFSANDQMHPAELFVAAADGSGEVRITDFNDAWLSEISLQEPERLTWKVADGTEIEGWLLKPVGFDPAKKYPMILKVHGGPHFLYGNYWFHNVHVHSASGSFVLYPNPRGSASYGHEFQYATRGKWGEMDQEDFFTGIDTAMAKYPQIDGKRLGISGGSYGGFMTNWLTATTDRFAAAVSSRTISNWFSWYGTSDVQALTEFEFFGPPWEQRELYTRLSPYTYVENVTAPTLIIQSEEDHRTPMNEAEMWYMALKKRKVPTELVRYPRSNHGLSRGGEPWLLVDRLERQRSWLVHWLIDVPEGKMEKTEETQE